MCEGIINAKAHIGILEALYVIIKETSFSGRSVFI